MHFRDVVTLADVVWVDNDAQLAAAARQWRGVVALDTEFIRTDTFYPVPGLYQVASAGRVYLIDPVHIVEWQPFLDILTDEAVRIVMHACQEDLELLYHHLGVQPANVFDTQFANAFVSADFSLSYAALVERLLNIELPKHATRSNWLARPLSDEQIQYAVEDVIYLHDLHDVLTARLGHEQRDAWFFSDMSLRGTYRPVDPDAYYLNLKKAWQLNSDQLGALQSLCAWREREAREQDVPRNRVVWDDHLLVFARKPRLTHEQVFQILPRGVARRYVTPIIEHHANGQGGQVPHPVPRPLTSSQGAVVKTLREIAREVASDLGLAPELLARKKDVEACVRHYAVHGSMSEHYEAWRATVLGSQFEPLLAKVED